MNLVHGLHTFVQTFGTGQAMLIAWLCVLALAAVVFLVLIGIGVHSAGRGRSRTGPDYQGAAWYYHQFLTGPTKSGEYGSPGRHPHERR